MNFHEMLQRTVKEGASDLFIKVGSPPSMRIDGRVRFLKSELITDEVAQRIFDTINQARRKPFDGIDGELDTSYELPGCGRFRCSISLQRSSLLFVLRHLNPIISSFDDLHLPAKQMKQLADGRRGLVLVTGVTGSGKSTTLAAVVNHINDTSSRHIITVEDPVEFVFEDRRSLITQREVGNDTESFSSALKYAMRQSPDVIMIGEMRDRETMEAAIHAAETGHLVISTLHTVNAQQTVERILNYFPEGQQPLIRIQLSMILDGVVSQRLVLCKDGKGRVPSVEIMMSNPTVREMLREGNSPELNQAIRDGSYFGCQTFNQSLSELIKNDRVSLAEAMAMSDNPEELKREMRGLESGAASHNYQPKTS